MTEERVTRIERVIKNRTYRFACLQCNGLCFLSTLYAMHVIAIDTILRGGVAASATLRLIAC